MADPLREYGYATQSPIAAGAFSQVVRARQLSTGAEVACKSFLKRAKGGRQPADLDGVASELAVLKILQDEAHGHIANLVGVHENEYELHAILEYCGGGSVQKYVNGQGHGVGLDELQAAYLSAQVGCALAAMHRLGVTHRDVKPENVIFVDRSRVAVRLVDFGFAVNHKERPNGRLRTVCGSPAYMAPEIVVQKPYLGPPVDVWALANFVYELIHSKPAFRAESIAQLNTRIRKANHSQFGPNVTRKAQSLIKRGLTVDVAERPDARSFTKSIIETFGLQQVNGMMTGAMSALMDEAA